MSVIRKVEAGSVHRQWLDSLQRSTVCRVTFICDLGHTGVQSNKRAARFTGSVIIAAGQPLDRADVVNALREIGRFEDFENSESTSFLRLRELAVLTVTVRNESHIGRARGLVSQHRAGTISHRKLVDVLRGRVGREI